MMLAQLRYYYHNNINISELSDEEALSLWQDLIYVRTEERKASESNQE